MTQPSAASALYPHLKQAEVSMRGEPRRSVSPLAAAMYPAHTPKPPPGWHAENISLVRRAFAQGLSDAEVARRYNVSKQVIGQIRKSK